MESRLTLPRTPQGGSGIPSKPLFKMRMVKEPLCGAEKSFMKKPSMHLVLIVIRKPFK